MSSLEEKIIELSKTKILLIVIGSLVFIAFGCWMVSLDVLQIESQRRFNNPLFVYGIGWSGIVFFGFCALYGTNKLFDRNPGLIFSRMGITDNSSGVSAGLIPWNEIAGFDVYVIHRQKMLVVLLKNPDKYIELGSVFKRTLNRANYKISGSPVVIASNSLKINFDELLKLCNEYYAKHGKYP